MGDLSEKRSSMLKDDLDDLAEKPDHITSDDSSEKSVEGSEKASKNDEAIITSKGNDEEAQRERAGTPPSSGDGAQHDEFSVYWSEPVDQDPENPMNWSLARKNSIIGAISFITFLSPLASSMFAPGVPDVIADFNTTSKIISTFVVSIYVLGFAFGPLAVAPVTELVGRNPVYHVCNILSVIFTVISAVSVNAGMLLAFRFLSGVAGVGALTIGSATIADMIPPERRGLYMAMWSMGPLFGPVVGPICGGYLVQAAGWRWVFWVLAIATGIATVACFFVLKETSAAIILEKKAARIRKETGNDNYIARTGVDRSLTSKQVIMQSIVRPLRILFLSPMASMMCLYIAVLYGLMYILFTTFTFVFQDNYGFDTGTAGLSFLGSGVGTLFGLVYAASLSDRVVKRKIAAGQKPVPEDRLPLYMTLPGSLTIPVGLFIYGWGAHYHVHWIVPQIGTVFTSVGMIVIVMSIQTYFVDVYTVHAASAIAASTVLRSLAGALLPLCGLQVYDTLGLGWGNSLLAFLALGLAPVPMLFGMFGERIRARSPSGV